MTEETADQQVADQSATTDTAEQKPDNAVEVSQLQAQFKELQSRVASLTEEKEAILNNKDQILAEKRALESQYKGIDPDQLKAYQNFEKQKRENELLQLAADGKLDVLSHRFTEDLTKQYSKERTELEDQINSLKSNLQEYEDQLHSERENNAMMQKRGYLKELVSGDQSFLNDHFDKFYRLYGDSIDFDKDTGKVYALGEKGSRMVDTRTGDLMSFEDYYNREKAQTGIFWKGGAGSGVKSAGGDQAIGSDPTKWSRPDQVAFIQEHGQKKFADLLAKSRKSQK